MTSRIIYSNRPDLLFWNYVNIQSNSYSLNKGSLFHLFIYLFIYFYFYFERALCRHDHSAGRKYSAVFLHIENEKNDQNSLPHPLECSELSKSDTTLIHTTQLSKQENKFSFFLKWPERFLSFSAHQIISPWTGISIKRRKINFQHRIVLTKIEVREISSTLYFIWVYKITVIKNINYIKIKSGWERYVHKTQIFV